MERELSSLSVNRVIELYKQQEVKEMNSNTFFDKKIGPQRYKVNVLHKGKERWKYCTKIERARFLQQSAIEAGLSSIILQKSNVDGKYHSI